MQFRDHGVSGQDFTKNEVKLNIVPEIIFLCILFSWPGVGDDAGVQDQHPSDRSLWHRWQHSQYHRAQVYIQDNQDHLHENMFTMLVVNHY